MSTEESAITDFLNSSPKNSFGRKEIARKAMSREDYEKNQRWADRPLAALVANGSIHVDEGGHYTVSK